MDEVNHNKTINSDGSVISKFYDSRLGRDVVIKFENIEAYNFFKLSGGINISAFTGGLSLILDQSDIYISFDGSFGSNVPNYNKKYGISLSIGNITTEDKDLKVKLSDNLTRKEILSGPSKGSSGYYGIGGGISIPDVDKYRDKVVITEFGIGTPQVNVQDRSYTFTFGELLDKIKNLLE